MVRAFTSALEAVRAHGRIPLISEIKCYSPKEGDLLLGRNPLVLAQMMERAGATCISVVTESAHFGGSLALLRDVIAAVSLPVLRKDFLLTREDVYVTRDCGASCLLLMVSMLDWPVLVDLHEAAHNCGLETLVEVHNKSELQQALTLDLDLLGLNNRNIRVLEVDDGTIANSLELLCQVPSGIRVISESAISTPEEITEVLRAGALGVLVGTSILRAADTAVAVRHMTGRIQG